MNQCEGPGLGQRPPGRPAGYQRWRGLLFLHWPIEAERLRPLVPPELEIETFGGSAWIGLIPFAMDRVRPWWSPPVPGISWFFETNVRTYVRRDGGNPGVWFFSLDANNPLAVAIARRYWYLNYHYARLRMQADASQVRYQSLGRRNGGGARYDILAESPPPASLGCAPAGSLEHFLVERYLMYARRRDGTLLSGRVHHPPYRFAPADVVHCHQDVTAACGIPLEGPCASALFAAQVDVGVYPYGR